MNYCRLLILIFCLSIFLIAPSCIEEKAIREKKQAQLIEKMKDSNPALFDPSLAQEKAPAEFIVKFRTTKGNFVVKVHRHWAPNSADRFYNLVKNDFYKLCPFYRVMPGKAVEFGINIQKKVTEVWKQEVIKSDKKLKHNKRGYIAFVTDRDTKHKNTQVLVNLISNFDYDDIGIIPFGEIVKGIDTFSRLEARYGEIQEKGNGRGFSIIKGSRRGRRYMRKNFPHLDYIKSILIEDES